MKVHGTGPVIVLLSTLSACASSTALPRLGVQPVSGATETAPPNLSPLAMKPATRDAPAPEAPAAPRQHRQLERQLHRIADRQLDVTRSDVEELFEELRAQRMLSESLLARARRELAEHEDALFERARSALRPLRDFSEVRADARGTVIGVPCETLFRGEGSALSAEAKPRLTEIARIVSELVPSGPILIEVHAADRDRRQSLDLAQQRALAVRAQLIEIGIAPERITALGRQPNTAQHTDFPSSMEIVLGSSASDARGVAHP